VDDLYPTPHSAAKLYAAFGWRVVPCQVGKKVPAVRDWPTVATVDSEQINEWWLGQYQSCGVCIVTGAESGLYVLDVDVANGKQGPATLKALLAERGESKMPPTYTVRTPSGGLHFYFRYPADGRIIRNDAGSKLGPGLDIRGEGGQVVAPPTQGYSWAPGRSLWELDLTEMPSGV
jgi:hypothetical protein